MKKNYEGYGWHYYQLNSYDDPFYGPSYTDYAIYY
jgi:hypothetical protein